MTTPSAGARTMTSATTFDASVRRETSPGPSPRFRREHALDALITLRGFSTGLHSLRPCRNPTATSQPTTVGTLGPGHAGHHSDGDQRDGADALRNVLPGHRARVPTARS